MGVVLPAEGFLQGLRDICDGTARPADFRRGHHRLPSGGRRAHRDTIGVTPDLTTFGKIIGARHAGRCIRRQRRDDHGEWSHRSGAVYQAGTLSGNPVAMAAGLAQIGYLNEHRELYTQLNETGDWFYGEIENTVREAGLPYQVNHIGSLGSLFFTGEPVTDYESAKTSDTKAYAAYCNFMMDHGVYIAPAQFEAMFLSMMHTREELTQTLSVMREYFLG